MALALGAYALAMTLGRGDFGAANAGMLAAAAIGMFVFLRIETHAASPLISRDLFRDPILRAGFVCSLLVSTVLFATLIVGPFHLARVFDLSPAAIGAIVAAGPIAAAFVGVPAGRLADRFGAGLVSLAGLVGIEIGCVLIVMIPATSGPLGYLFATVVLTIGYALFQNANNAHVMQGVDPRKRGVVAGLINLSRNLGQVTGAAAMGALFAYASGPIDVLHAAPASVDFGTRATYVVAILLIGAAIFFAARKAALKR
jgi:MFS family permease